MYVFYLLFLWKCEVLRQLGGTQSRKYEMFTEPDTRKRVEYLKKYYNVLEFLEKILGVINNSPNDIILT